MVSGHGWLTCRLVDARVGPDLVDEVLRSGLDRLAADLESDRWHQHHADLPHREVWTLDADWSSRSRKSAAIRTVKTQVNSVIKTYGGPYLAAYEPRSRSSGDECGDPSRR
jgi:hypothetical protein